MTTKCFTLNFQSRDLQSNCLNLNSFQKIHVDNPTLDTFDEVAKECVDSNYSVVLICIFANAHQDGFEYDDKKRFDISELFHKFAHIKSTQIIFFINDKNVIYTGLTQCANLLACFGNLQDLHIDDDIENKLRELQINSEQTTDFADFDQTHENVESKAPISVLENVFQSKSFVKNEVTNKEVYKIAKHIPEKVDGMCVILSFDSKCTGTWGENITKVEDIESIVDKVEDTFETIGFSVRKETNLTSKKVKELMEELSNIKKNIDCFVLCLITYCNDGEFYTSNKTVPIYKFMKDVASFINLKDKPKIFLIQNPYTKNCESESINLRNFWPKEDKKRFNLTDHFVDFVLLYSFHEKDASNNLTRLNFTKNLCNMIMGNCSKGDLLTMIREMFSNMTITSNKNNLSSQTDCCGHSLHVYLKSTLRKSIRLESKSIPMACDQQHIQTTKELIDSKSLSYPMRDRAGKCLILEYESVSGNCDENLLSSIKTLRDTFEKDLNFKTEYYNGIKDYDESISWTNKELNNIKGNFDCFCLFIFTNNNPNARTTREQIIAYFDNHKPMFGKPKFIFVQGVQEMSITPDSIDIEIHNKNTLSSSPGKITIAKHSDFLIFFNNNANLGISISLLCKEILEKYHNYDLSSILSFVFEKMSTEAELQEMPYINSTLTRLFNLKHLSSNSNQIFYRISKNDKGKCLVLNYENFQIEYPRPGTEEDVIALQKLFENNLKFDFSREDNLNSTDTRDVLDKLMESDLSMYSCVVLCFLSHGNFQGRLCCYDGFVNIDDLINALCKNEHLLNKPKIILIQSCQGILDEYGIEDYPNMKRQFSFAKHSGVFLFSSSFPGHPSYREPSNEKVRVKGSIFIQEFCELFLQNYLKHDLSTIATKVCQNIGYHFHTGQREGKSHGKRQMPHTFSTLKGSVMFE